MNYIPADTLMDIGERMAQDLREYADAAEQAGTPITATQELLDEFDALHAFWYAPDTRDEETEPMKPVEEGVQP